MNHYDYKPFEHGLDEFVERLKNPAASRALSRLKFMVLAAAWCDYGIWDTETDNEEALAAAWEDMHLAFCGFGDSSMTGVVIHLWTAVGSDFWEAGVSCLNEAASAAEEATSKTVARRYLLHYRIQTVRTPEMGYDLPAVVPVTGSRIREWAAKNGLPPRKTEAQMALIEEYERLGLINLEAEGYFVGHGGAQFEPGSAMAVNPAMAKLQPPTLKLVE